VANRPGCSQAAKRPPLSAGGRRRACGRRVRTSCAGPRTACCAGTARAGRPADLGDEVYPHGWRLPGPWGWQHRPFGPKRISITASRPSRGPTCSQPRRNWPTSASASPGHPRSIPGSSPCAVTRSPPCCSYSSRSSSLASTEGGPRQARPAPGSEQITRLCPAVPTVCDVREPRIAPAMRALSESRGRLRAVSRNAW
jgi:hypothetical protein